MESQLKKWILGNLTWLMMILAMCIGVFFSVKNLEKQADASEVKIAHLFQTTSEMKQVDVRADTKLDAIANDLREIKSDLREVRTILSKRTAERVEADDGIFRTVAKIK